MIELPIKNFPSQQAIFDSPKRFKIVVKGRRFGLTKGATNDFVRQALEEKFEKGLWVDVINGNIEKYIERYFLPVLRKLPRGLWRWRQQQKVLEINKAYIDFRSADRPENMEGFGYDKSFLNEAGIILKDEYLWDNAIRPMFWDFPGRHVIGGTPKGKGGKFYGLYQLGLNPNNPFYQSFHFSSFDSPFKQIHDLINEDIAAMPDRVIQQEIYANFLEDTGVVFRGFMEIMDAEPKEPYRDHLYVIGCDLAKVQDFTVVAVYDMARNSQVYQARWNKLDWGMTKARIAQTSKYFNGARVMIDATGLGDPIVDDLARMNTPVEPIKFTNEMKRQLIEKLATWIETKKIHMINIPETVSELSNFTYDISEQTGRIRYEAPVGFNDDIVIAHALAVWGLVPQMASESDKEPTAIKREFQKRLMKQMYQYSEDAEWREWEDVI